MKQKQSVIIGFLVVLSTAGWVVALAYPQQNTALAETKQEIASESSSPLDTLDWLVGNWVNEDKDRSTEFNCHFTKNGSFLMRSFGITNRDGGRLSGMQVIAWDPARESIRSWTFSSDGGFGEDTWSQNGNRYSLRSVHTFADGGRASMINVATFIDNDHFSWKSVQREIDGELQPDVEEIIFARAVPVENNVEGK